MVNYKNWAINAYRWATWPLRSAAAWRAVRKNQVPIAILFYHRVCDEFRNEWTMSQCEFLSHIDWLQANFELISLEEVQKRIAQGCNARPAVSITFDDGYADNSQWALPLLLKRQIPVTYFVSTNHVLREEPFAHDVAAGRTLRPNNLESLRALAKAGVEIGSHTRNHVDLGKIHNPTVLRDEVVNATRELEQKIGQPVRYFAFPFGQPENLNERAIELARENGLAGVCTTRPRWNPVGADPFCLDRFHGDPNLARMKNWLTFDPRHYGASGPMTHSREERNSDDPSRWPEVSV